MLGQLIEQDHIEQRLVYLNAAVVIDKAEFAKAIHEEADAGPRGTDHLRQGFLRNGRDESFPFSRLAKLRHQQENPRQALFAGVEELIDKIGLSAHAAGQQEFQEPVREGMLLMHHADHLIPSNPKRHARVYRGGRGQAQSRHRRKRLLSNEVPGGEERGRNEFSVRAWSHDVEFRLAEQMVYRGTSA